MRGYYGIGIENGKCEQNIGTLWRSAKLLGADFIFTIGERYKHQITDTCKTPKSIPMFHYDDFEDFHKHMPNNCELVGIELDSRSVQLKEFRHPEQCIYLLGAEDVGLSKEALNKCTHVIQLTGDFSMNVSVAGSIVIHDRVMKNT